MKSFVIGALALGLWAGAAPAQLVSASDPAAFAKTLQDLGYKPSEINPNDGTPILTADVDDWMTAFAFGACEEGRNCDYVVLASSFTDVKNPPLAWVNKINRELDLAHIFVGEDGSLSLTLAIPMGTDGVPLTTLRYALTQWRSAVAYVSQSALDEKLAQ